MPGSVQDIKDLTPNPDTIAQLEALLEDAKAGRVRTVVFFCGWHDDVVTHGWSIDSRNTRKRLIGEMAMLQFDMLANQSLYEYDSVLAHAINQD